MFVSIIFDVEYFGMGERHKWFLKNIFHAKENNCLVITHEFLKQHYKEYTNKCESRFYNEFEMEKLSEEEYAHVSKGFIKDEIFESLEDQFVSRSEMLSYLFQNRYERLEREIIQIIDEELSKRKDEKIDAIFNCLDAFASIFYLGEYYHCSIISYCFSAIKKVHGYTQTLYMTTINGAIRQSEETEKRYKEYINGKQVPITFSNRELLAIFGKEKNIPLIKVMEYEPAHELGICKMASSIYPYDYLKYKYTDTDLYYEARRKLETTDIIIRDHPGIPWNGNDKGPKKEHERNDPISFILSCKRVASIDSQILLKALLWNRTIFSQGHLSAVEFMCSKDIRCVQKVDVNKLNYYIFGYLIPADYMFDTRYWKWRLTQKPSEYEIYIKHLNYYVNYFGYNRQLLLKTNESERFRYILNSRNINKNLIDDLLEKETVFNINYEVLYSKIRLRIEDKDTYKEIICVNEQLDDVIRSRFVFINEKIIQQIAFYPFVDVGGFVQIKRVCIDNAELEKNDIMRYVEKVEGDMDLGLKVVCSGKHEISVEWIYCFK